MLTGCVISWNDPEVGSRQLVRTEMMGILRDLAFPHSKSALLDIDSSNEELKEREPCTERSRFGFKRRPTTLKVKEDEHPRRSFHL